MIHRLCVLILLAGVWAAPVKAEPGLPLGFGGPFELLDHTGTLRTEADFRGKFLLVYFGYMSCPDFCPTGLAELAAALDALGGKADQVQAVFVSVDPARDRPEPLAEYVRAFHADIIGLTGSEGQVRQAAKAWRVHRVKVPKPESGADDYLVSHSPNTYLMGPDGSFQAIFPHGTSAEKIVTAVNRRLNPS